MQSSIPKRLVFRFDEKHWHDEQGILNKYFELFGRSDNCYFRAIPPTESRKMHLILDVHCNDDFKPSIREIEYEVFRVKKDSE